MMLRPNGPDTVVADIIIVSEAGRRALVEHEVEIAVLAEAIEERDREASGDRL